MNRTTYLSATSLSQTRLRQDMMRKLTNLGFYMGDIQFEMDENEIESVCISILRPASDWREISVRVRCFVGNANWFIEGDDNYMSALDDRELSLVLGHYGAGKHVVLPNWKKVWVVSSGYSRISRRVHGTFEYFSNKASAFEIATQHKMTVFCIVVPVSTPTSDDTICEAVSEFEFDACRDASNFKILVEPICFGGSIA